MVIKLEDAKEYRDRLHNLDLNNIKDENFYKILRYNFLKLNEGCFNQAYDDATRKLISPGFTPKGNPTIGIGFNMNAEGSREIWIEAFNKNDKNYISFEDAKNGKAKLNQTQIDKLFEKSLIDMKKKLYKTYGEYFNKFRVNERLMIEDAYFNYPKLVNKSSQFYRYIINYVETDNISFLKSAIHEIKHRSNPKKNTGIQNRRDIQAIMLSSYLTPFYSKPSENLLPYKNIEAKLADTIIPRNIDHWPKAQDSNYYIWRTCMDEKVRPKHAELEGKIFRSTENPLSDDFNCRCYQERLPANIQIIIDNELKHIDHLSFMIYEARNISNLLMQNYL